MLLLLEGELCMGCWSDAVCRKVAACPQRKL